jgi:serine protease AprX
MYLKRGIVRLKLRAALMASMFIIPGLVSVLSQAQEAPKQQGIFLYMQAGTFDPLKDPLPFSDELKGSDGWGYYIVQFIGPVRDAWKDEMASEGAILYGYLPDYAFIVRLDPDKVACAAGLPFVRWVGPYHPGYKLSPYLKDRSGTVEMSALFFDDGPALQKRLRDIDIEVLWTDQLAVRVRADISMARVMAFIPEVQWVEPLDPVTLLNDNDACILNLRQQTDGNFTNDGLSLWSYNNSKFEGLATGKGVIVAVQDSGVDGNHVDFTGKKVFYKSYFGSADWTDSMGHGTHVAGTVLGTGQGQSGMYAGMAPDAGLIAFELISSTISPEGRNAASIKDAQDHGGYICTNSWGDLSLQGTYGTMAMAYDQAVRDCDPQEPGNQSMIVVFAAGNEGFGGIREPATAKNIITVGATGNNVNLDPDQIASFSSNGPTNDGRRKPDVMAPGYRVTSCQAGSTNGYFTADGTSMAAPGVAGACAVVVQQYKDNNGAVPSPAMVKALLANGAEIMSSSYDYPGNGQGWGRVNVQKSLLSNKTYQILSDDQKVSLKTGEQMIYNASVVTADWPLKVTLAWTDPPGTASANRELVNDLDLELVSPSGQVYYGNNFTNGQSRPGGNPDNLNNLEGFYLKQPELGGWTIKVTGTNVAQGPQDYAIAFSGDIDVSLDFIDLQVIGGPTIDTAEPAEGKEVTFYATIRNNGTLPAPGALYRFTVNEKQIYNFTIKEFKENTTMNISAKWVPTRGKFTVRVELDPQNIIREKNESNNKRQFSFEVLFHGLVVVSNSEELEVPPGAAAVFNLDVKNSGNANDTYTINKLGGGPPPGWKENLTASNVPVRKLSSERANFTIWPPANATAGEGYSTRVLVTSEGNSSYTQTVNMSVKVKQVFGMNFTTDSPIERKVDPGQRLVCNFTISNPGNGKDYFSVRSAVVGRPIAWLYGLNQSNITLGPRSSANLSLSMDIPREAYANESLTLNISASSAQSGTRSFRIRTVVRQLFSTDLVVDGATDRAAPGGNLTYRLYLKNTGNGNDTLMFKIGAPEGWTATLDRQAAILAPRAESSHELSLQCPLGSIAGSYDVNVSCTGSGGNTTYHIINVTVTQVYKVSLGLEPVNGTLTQGQSCDFTLTVGNLGNGNDTFAFTTLNLPDGIFANYTPETIDLGPGDENTVTVTVSTRNTTAAVNHTFIFKVISQGKLTVYDTTPVALEVLAIPVVIPPIVNPPTHNDTGGSGFEIPWLPLIAIVIIVGAAGGAAAYARSRKKKPAWEPTQPAQTPAVPAEAVTLVEPLGMKSYNGFISDYSRTNHREDYADTSSPFSVPPSHGVQLGAGNLTKTQGGLNDVIDKEVEPGEGAVDQQGSGLSALDAHCMEHKARMDAAHEKMDKLTQESESQKEGPGAIDPYKETWSYRSPDEQQFQGSDDLTKIDEAQKALDKLKADKEKLDAESKELNVDSEKLTPDLSKEYAADTSLTGKPKDWYVDKGMPLADKLPGKLGEWAKEGVKFGDRGARGIEPSRDSGPRFERPDWSPDDESAVQGGRPEPPPQYERVEPLPPPQQAAPPRPAPVTKSVTELDELMSRLKKLSGK